MQLACFCPRRSLKLLKLADRPTPATDVLDAERLIEDLQQALNALSSSISADAVFEGLAAAAREVEDTLSATID
jgi:hypothetical protein